jgi:hypothetical protein
MPQAATPIDQSIVSNIVLTSDPYLTVALPSGFLYRIFCYFVWSQSGAMNGGVNVGLQTDVTADMTWAAPDSGSSMQALGSGASISINGVSGNHAVTIFGTVNVSAPANLSVIRSQAASNPNPTIIRHNSILIAEAVSLTTAPPALSALPTFVAPLVQQNYNVPVPSPVGTTVLVGGTATGVIAARPSRRGVAFCNPSTTNNIYLCPANQTPQVGQGLVLVPGGFVPIMGNDNNLINVTNGWSAISDGVNVPLSVLEFV